jgi:DNA repair exonuclease SbcCD ATPase subunit
MIERSLNRVEIRGFGLFHDYQDVDFRKYPRDAIIGVFGDNQDGEGGYDSNASGKTTLLNAISWGLFGLLPIQGESSRAIHKEQIVNHQSKKGSVSQTYSVGDQQILLENSITAKGTKQTKLFINGEEYIANTATQKREKFYTLMGIGGKDKNNFIDFLNRCYFSGDVTKSFASKNFSNKDRLAIIAQVKQMGVLDLAAKKAEEKAKELNKRLSEIQFQIDDRYSKIDKNFNIDNARNRDIHLNKILDEEEANSKLISEELSKYDDILRIKKEIDALEKELVPITKQIDDQIVVINSYCEKLNDSQDLGFSLHVELDKLSPDNEVYKAQSSIIGSKIMNAENSKTVLNARLTEFRIEIENSKKLIEKLKAGDHLECPACKTPLLHDDKGLHLIEHINKVIENQTKIIDGNTIKCGGITVEISGIDKVLVSLREEQKEFIERETKIRALKERIVDEKKKYEALYEKAKDYVISNEQYEVFEPEPRYLKYENYAEYETKRTEIGKKQIELNAIKEPEYTIKDLELVNQKIKNLSLEIQNLENQIELQTKYEKEITALSKEKTEKSKDYLNYNYWLSGFKQLKNIELVETEPELENSVNKILAELGTGITVQFDVNVEEGGLAINLIEESGNELALELFSTGQANRIGLAAGLALGNLASDSNTQYGFTLWDEVLDGLDNTGQDMFFDILKKLPGLKLVISHDKKLQNLFEHKIFISRKNHSSTIKMES